MPNALHEVIESWEHERMQTIVINSQKGGSGKTMLCKHLSVEAERAGDGPVFLIDTDPQGTLTAWHTKREAETPARLEIAAQLFKLADFVLFPVQPSEDDLTILFATPVGRLS